MDSTRTRMIRVIFTRTQPVRDSKNDPELGTLELELESVKVDSVTALLKVHSQITKPRVYIGRFVTPTMKRKRQKNQKLGENEIIIPAVKSKMTKMSNVLRLPMLWENVKHLTRGTVKILFSSILIRLHLVQYFSQMVSMSTHFNCFSFVLQEKREFWACLLPSTFLPIGYPIYAKPMRYILSQLNNKFPRIENLSKDHGGISQLVAWWRSADTLRQGLQWFVERA